MTPANSNADDYRGVRADEITWTLAPIDIPDRIDLLTLDDAETFDCAVRLQDELRWLRPLLHEAVRRIHQLTAQNKRDAARIQDLLRERAQMRQPNRRRP